MSRTRDLASILGKTEAANTTNVALGTGGGGLDSASTIQLIDSDYVSNLGGACAFCNFNLSNHAAGETLNNSSISDTGTGLADLNFSNNFSNANYASASANPGVASISARNFSSGPYAQATNKCSYAREGSDGNANAPNASYQALTHFGTLA